MSSLCAVAEGPAQRCCPLLHFLGSGSLLQVLSNGLWNPLCTKPRAFGLKDQVRPKWAACSFHPKGTLERLITYVQGFLPLDDSHSPNPTSLLKDGHAPDFHITASSTHSRIRNPIATAALLLEILEVVAEPIVKIWEVPVNKVFDCH